MLAWLQLWVGSRLCLDSPQKENSSVTFRANLKCQQQFWHFQDPQPQWFSFDSSHSPVGRMWQSSSFASCNILLFYYYIIDISQSLVAKSQTVLETSAFLFWPKTQKIKKHQPESAWKPKILGNCWAVDIFWIIMKTVNDVCCWVNYIFNEHGKILKHNGPWMFMRVILVLYVV